MNYVFFDCECSNCLKGEGKICSFGYVKTDENFNIIKKKDTLMNPDAPFRLGDAAHGNGIRLAYPLFRFTSCHTFPTYYEEIKKLLETPDTLAFGFAVTQDVSYLAYTCKRYNLPVFNFRFYDIQLLEKIIHQNKNPNGLDTLINQYKIEPSTFHRSDDDAFMTMEVLRGILNENSISVPQMIQIYPEPLCTSADFVKVLEQRRVQKARKKALNEKIDQMFISLDKISPVLSDYDSNFAKKAFYFDYKMLSYRLDKIRLLATMIKRKGGYITRNPNKADRLVVEKGKGVSNTIQLKEEAQILSFDQISADLHVK
ncbi:MAG: 3'-5' exonuclease [Bacilli bacterium]